MTEAKKVVQAVCAVTMFDVCFCSLVIRCDSQPGSAVSLGASPWLLLILTHPLCASCASRRGLRSDQHWHGHCDHLPVSERGHADGGSGKTEGQAMGATHGLSPNAVLLCVSHFQSGHFTRHAGVCHHSSW